MVDAHPPPEEYVERLRRIATSLPEAHEQDAWRGVRWRIRSATFAHTLVIIDGTPTSYASAARTDGPTTVLTFRATGDELLFFRQAGPPYFSPLGWDTLAGMVLDGDTDWSEVAEVVTESYRIQAPRRLARLLGD
jgi:hypothetical protein